MERDFAFLRNEHAQQTWRILDDCLIAKLLGPRTVAEFDDVAGGSSSREELTPFSRKCACLWRQLYGARCGHHNPAATRAANLKRAASSRGPLRRATVGVLAAARLAVQCKRARCQCSAASWRRHGSEHSVE